MNVGVGVERGGDGGRGRGRKRGREGGGMKRELCVCVRYLYSVGGRRGPGVGGGEDGALVTRVRKSASLSERAII